MRTLWKRTIAIALAFSYFYAPGLYAKEPDVNADAKEQLAYYHDSGLYDTDVASVIDSAKSYLAQRIESNEASESPQKLAIVLDIDETSLSNYPGIKNLNYTGELSLLDDYIALGQDPPIKPTLELFKLAQQHHVSIFFVTGRLENVRESTLKNLKKVGFSDWQAAYFRPESDNTYSVIPYKSSIRKKITDEGYNIVLNIGDQMSDLQGGFAERTLKLPNPYYFIP